MMIGIVFSLNRAMQLDGTLRSFLMHCRDPEDVQLHILYKAKDSRNELQYKQLMREYSGYSFIHFAKQKDFRQDLLGLLLEHATGRPVGNFHKALLGLGEHLGRIGRHLFAINGNRYVMFLVDDNLFIGKFSLSEAQETLEEHRDAIGFSLRLGSNITYCYPLNRNQSIPAFSHLAKHMLKFNWTGSDCDFGYPLEVSSSIYRLDELFPLLCSLPFENPNRLEGGMASFGPRLRETTPYLLCYDTSVTFCNPVNIVQTQWVNRAGSSNTYSSESLAQKFDEGYRINIDEYKYFIPNACHQEVDLVLEKKVVLDSTS